MDAQDKPIHHATEPSGNGASNEAKNPHEYYRVESAIDLGSRSRLRTSRILTEQSGLLEGGRQFALGSGATAPREEELTIVRENADAIASDSALPPYDPEQNPQDKVIEVEYQKLLRDRDEEELGLKHNQATLAERKDEAARARGRVPPLPPEPSLLLKAAAVAALAATIAPAAHDFLWVLPDEFEFFAWLLSIITGVVFGALIVLLILADNHHIDRRSLMNWMGLAGGIGIGLALFLLRIKGADGGEQFIFGLATSILEIAIVVFLESLAVSRRAALRQRLPLEAAATEAEGLVRAQEMEVVRRKTMVNQIKEQIDDHGAYLAERHLLATRLNEIRDAARKAAEAGYLKGISENRGKVLGVK
jgi:hypothetical protein